MRSSNLKKPGEKLWTHNEVLIACVGTVLIVGLVLSVRDSNKSRGQGRSVLGLMYMKQLGQALAIYSEANDGVPAIDLSRVPDSVFAEKDFKLRYRYDDTPRGWGNMFREWQYRGNASVYPIPRGRAESVIDLVTITGRLHVDHALSRAKELVDQEIAEQGVLAVLPHDCHWLKGESPHIGRFCSGSYIRLGFDLSTRKKRNIAEKLDTGWWSNTFAPEWRGDSSRWLQD